MTWDKTEIEKIYTQFLKRLLGVNVSTTNVMIRSENGRYPLKLKVHPKAVGLIKYINEKNDDHLSKVTYEYEKQMAETCNRPNYIASYQKSTIKVGNNNIVYQTKRKVKKLLESYYYSVWKDQLNQTNH